MRKLARHPAWWLLIIVLAGTLLRLLRLDARELWLDEACIAWFARMPSMGGMVDALAQENNPPLFYLIMFGWYRLFGESEVLFRLPSMLMGIGLIPMTWLTVKRVSDSTLAAGLAAGLIAASPLAIYYSVEARSYVMLWLLALATIERLLAGIKGDSVWPFIVAGVLTLAGLYTHYYGLFILPVWGPALLATDRKLRWKAGLSFGFACGAFLPWALLFMIGHTQTGGTDWMQSYWAGPWAGIASSAKVLSLSTPFPKYLGELGLLHLRPWFSWANLFWFGLPVALGICSLIRGKRGAGLAVSGILLVGILSPVVFPLLASTMRSIYLPGRYELVIYGAWAVCWGLGFAWVLELLKGRVRGLGASAVVMISIGLMGVTTWPYISRPAAPRSGEAAASRLAQLKQDAAIVMIGLERATMEHHLELRGATQRRMSFPGEVVFHPGWITPSAHKDETLAREAVVISGVLQDHSSVALVLPLRGDGKVGLPRIIGALWRELMARGWTPGSPETFGRTGIVVFTKSIDNHVL
jgi:4-amino-4-deoxy-L-arabinose transferase-like glycosyltransferase